MKPNQQAYISLTQVINQMLAETMDENTIESLRSMLDLSAFQPIRAVIETKIIEVGNFLKSKEDPKEESVPKEEPQKPFWTSTNLVDDGQVNEETRKEIESLLNSPPFEYENDIKDFFKTSSLNMSPHFYDKIGLKPLVPPKKDPI